MREQGLPAIFGRGGRDRVLMALAVNGPMYVRELGRLIQSDSRKVFSMVQVLESTGVVVKRDRAGGRKYAALNRSFPAYVQLKAFLEALATDYEVPRRAVPRFVHGMPLDRDAWEGGSIDTLFGSANRTRILLVATAAGGLEQGSIARVLGLNLGSAAYAIKTLEESGLVESVRVNSFRVVQLNAKYRHHDLFSNLMEALIKQFPEFAALAEAGLSTGRLETLRVRKNESPLERFDDLQPTSKKRRVSRVPQVLISERCTIIAASLASGEAVQIRTLFARLMERDRLYRGLRLLRKYGLCQIDHERPSRVRLNPDHSLAAEFQLLLFRIAQQFQIPMFGDKRDRRSFDAHPVTGRPSIPALFGSPLRTKLLALIAASDGIDATFAAALLGHELTPVAGAMRSLARRKVLTQLTSNGRKVFQLAGGLSFASELLVLLQAIDRVSSGEYAALAKNASLRRDQPRRHATSHLRLR